MELRARILVVEDEPDIRRFVRMTLESEGHEVFEAPTLQRGLIEAGSRRPGTWWWSTSACPTEMAWS